MSGKPIDEAVTLLEAMQERWCASTAGKDGSRRIATFDPARGARGEDDFDNEVSATRRCASDLALAIERIRALTAAQQQGQAVAECHCATCTCAPGMTPAVRFDTSPAAQEGAVRDHLIALGWTPPNTAPPPSVPVGWKLVPVIPTDGMLAAAIQARDERIQRRAQASGALVIGGQSAAYTFHDTYRAMLAAAPALAQQPGAVECPHRTRCDCLAACKYGYAGGGATQHQEPKS